MSPAVIRISSTSKNIGLSEKSRGVVADLEKLTFDTVPVRVPILDPTRAPATSGQPPSFKEIALNWTALLSFLRIVHRVIAATTRLLSYPLAVACAPLPVLPVICFSAPGSLMEKVHPPSV